MRFFEFGNYDPAERMVMVLRNYIGRASSQKTPMKLNWMGFNKVLKLNGFDMIADYETFKAMYDASPAIQGMVDNFNDDYIELKVPGAGSEAEKPDGTKDSQAEVDKIAAGAAPKQLASQT